MDFKECYRVLEIEIGASREAVDAAYCRLLERWHPDRAASGDPEAVREAQRMVQAINDAHQTLVKVAPDSVKPPVPPPTGAIPTTGAKPTLRPLPAGPPASARPPPRLPSPETGAARSAPVAGAPPPPPPVPAPTKSRPPPPPAASAPPPAPLPGDRPGQTPAGQALDKPGTPSQVEGPAAPPALPSGLRRQAAAFYETLFPAGSPRRRFGPVILAAALVLVLLLGKCAISSSVSRSAPAPDPKTTGRLLVKSNLANATIEATRLPPPGEAAPASVPGSAGQELSGLPPGQYAVTARADGWPEMHGEVKVDAARTAEIAIHFKSGSLRLDSVPTGATVRLGEAELGQTPLLIPQLPPGECQLLLEYPAWPVLPYTATITENVASAATVRLPHGRLTVETTPPGATVLLGGKAIGRTPLTLERVPAGTKKLTLQAADFPTLEVSVNVEDRGEAKVSPQLGSYLPALDPAELLRDVWVPDSTDNTVVPFDAITGPFQPRNGIVRNLNRKRLSENWLQKRYRFSATVRSYDPGKGLVEFEEQKSDLARYRVLATLTPGARNARDLAVRLAKGATFSLYGRLSVGEEPRWPFKVITFEITAAEPLR